MYTDLYDYIGALTDTLNNWLLAHTDPTVWANEWAGDDDPDWESLYEKHPVFKNDYFTFDLKEAALTRTAQKEKNIWRTCGKCHVTQESETCEICGRNTRRAKQEEIIAWYQENGIVPNPNIIRQAMEEDGFKTYRAAIEYLTRPIEEEIEQCLRGLSSSCGQEIIQSIAWANHICHVNGNIIEDYGEYFGIDCTTVDTISQGGLSDYFSQEQIDEIFNA